MVAGGAWASDALTLAISLTIPESTFTRGKVKKFQSHANFNQLNRHIESETMVGDIDPGEPEPDLEAEEARAGLGPLVDALVAH